ncbi:MAG: alpha/beta hydrolase [Myxococcaceae bacterium]|nr:alpha/beta hydrolase [Myxococcaceae bacterium]
MPGFAEHFARSSLTRLRGYSTRYVKTSQGRVHVLEARARGPLPPLVLLHGLSSAGVHFLPMLGLLERAFSRVVLPDLPGHGFSDTPSTLDATSLREGLFEALDDVTRGGPVLLFGNSLGGYAAIRYALERPERVKALLLASPGGGEMTDDELLALRTTFRLESHGDALAFIDRLLASRSRIRHLYAWGLRRQLRRPEVEAILAAATREQLLKPEELAALSHPILFVWGKAERLLPARHLDFFRSHLPPHAHVVEPTGWGHSPFLDDGAGLARQLIDFVRRHA